MLIPDFLEFKFNLRRCVYYTLWEKKEVSIRCLPIPIPYHISEEVLALYIPADARDDALWPP
jgi:hypothetical protein